MHYVGLSFQADRFLTDVVEIAAMSSLRDLKYRARIPIEKGCLLYGIMDETNTLQEGEVYIATQIPDEYGEWQHRVLTGDRFAISRAPALHPGDVQLARAVDVEPGNPLKALRNCIVFSQRGERDLPSMLSGGDLDGDLFHIIYDERLIPAYTVAPADYAPTPPRDLGRPVEVNDIVDFFIEFMNMDRLGVISNKHKVRADRKSEGTMDTECVMLAKLASDAVDFSKSGNPVSSMSSYLLITLTLACLQADMKQVSTALFDPSQGLPQCETRNMKPMSHAPRSQLADSNKRYLPVQTASGPISWLLVIHL